MRSIFFHMALDGLGEPQWWEYQCRTALLIFRVPKKFLEAVNRLNYEVYQREAGLAFIRSLSTQLCYNYCYCVLAV